MSNISDKIGEIGTERYENITSQDYAGSTILTALTVASYGAAIYCANVFDDLKKTVAAVVIGTGFTVGAYFWHKVAKKRIKKALAEDITEAVLKDVKENPMDYEDYLKNAVIEGNYVQIGNKRLPLGEMAAINQVFLEKLVAFYHANKDRISGSVMNGLDFMLSNGNGGKASRKKLPTGTNGD